MHCAIAQLCSQEKENIVKCLKGSEHGDMIAFE